MLLNYIIREMPKSVQVIKVIYISSKVQSNCGSLIVEEIFTTRSVKRISELLSWFFFFFCVWLLYGHDCIIHSDLSLFISDFFSHALFSSRVGTKTPTKLLPWFVITYVYGFVSFT